MSKTLHVAFSILAAVFLTALAATLHPIAGLATAAVTLIYIVYAVIPLSQGLTMLEHRKLAKYRKSTTRDDRFVISTSGMGTAISRDGDVASLFIELTPAPLESVAYTDDGTGIPSVPLGIVADTLRQFDVTVDAIELISFGFVTSEDTPYARAYRPALRNNPAHWRTIIEVSVRLSTSMPEVNSRRDTDDGPEVGLMRLATVASKRLRNRLSDEGWRARMLTKSEVERFDQEVSAFAGDAFNHEGRFHMGSGKQWVAAYAAPGLKVAPSEYLGSSKAVGVVRRVVPHGARGGSVSTFVLLFGEDPESVKAQKQHKLRRLPNIQGDVLSHLLPLAQSPSVTAAVPQVTKREAGELVVDMGAGPAWGVGTLLGEAWVNGKLRRVSLTTASAKNGEVLYFQTNANFVRNVVSRLLTSGENVVVEASGDEWDAWISRMNNPRLTRKRGRANVVLTTSNGGEVRPRGNVLLLVLTPQLPKSARYYVAQQADGTMRIVHGRTYRDFTWTTQQAENQWWLHRG